MNVLISIQFTILYITFLGTIFAVSLAIMFTMLSSVLIAVMIRILF